MANQVIVTNTGNVQVALTPPANVQVQISRAAIGTVSNVPTANFANYAANVTASNQPNITSVGILANLTSTGTATFGNLVVTGNLQVGNLFANNANYSNFAGQVVDNTQSNITSLGTLTSLSVSGNITGANANLGNLVIANYFSGDGSSLSAINGANVSQVSNAGYADIAGTAYSVSGANVSGEVANANYSSYANIAASANSVAVANVSGIGNIAVINLDGNASNVLFGNGVFGPESGNLNANYANFAGEAFNVNASNITGTVANANYSAYAGEANTANLATFATTANAVAGANVSGTVANATFALDAGNSNLANLATYATTANSVALANVVGIGNIANINLDGSSSNVLFGNGVFAPESTSIANANYANFAGTAFSVSGSNVSGEVANANYSSYANIAATANSVAVGNVSGIGNIATINLDGSSSNVLFGNGVFAPESTSIANANYANFAGTVITNAQPNITSVGNLPYLQVSNSANATGVVSQLSAGNITFATNFSNVETYKITTQYHPNASTAYPTEKFIRSRGNVTNPTTAVSNDRIQQRGSYVYNGNTNVASFLETITATGTVNSNANAAYTGGQWSISTGNPSGDIGNGTASSPINALTFNNSGTLFITPGAPGNTSLGQSGSSMIITSYGSTTTNPAFAGGINYQRARGNRDAVTNVLAGDQIGRTVYIPYSNGAYQSTNVAQYTVTVDSSYSNNDVVVPMSHNFVTMANVGGVATARTTRINSTGNISMPGANIGAGIGGGQLAFGNDAGTTGQNNAAVAIGLRAANVSQGQQGVAIGYQAGSNTQSQFAVAIGGTSGETTQGQSAVAIGQSAGQNNQGAFSVAAGVNAGYNNQSTQSVALGYYAGANTQGQYSVAIGRQAGEFSQGANSFALGYAAGSTNQGNNSVAIGYAAGYANQANNSIILNATGSTLDQTTANTFTVKPVRQANTANVMFYDSSTGEITYDLANNTTVANANYSNFAGTLINGTSNITIPSANGTIAFSVNNTANLMLLENGGVVNAFPTSSVVNMMRINTFNNSLSDAHRITWARARGTNASPTSVQANDNLGVLSFFGHNGTSYQTGSIGFIRAKVDASYTTTGANIPIGMQVVVNDTNGGVNNQAKTHNFWANGNVTFANSVFATNDFSATGNVNANFAVITNDVNTGNVNIGTSSGANIATLRIYGDKSTISGIQLTNGQYVIYGENINPGSGYSPLAINMYNTANASIPVNRFYRARGNAVSSAAVVATDQISITNYGVYGDSGNTYLNVFDSPRAVVTGNDGAGNVTANLEFYSFNTGSNIVFTSSNTYTSGNLTVGDNLSADNVTINTNGFMKLASYTAAALTAITGQIGWMAAVSDSAQGSNPNGMIAFWDTTNSRWSYIHDNTAV